MDKRARSNREGTGRLGASLVLRIGHVESARLSQIAAGAGISRSEAMRRALGGYIARDGRPEGGAACPPEGVAS